MLGCFSNCFAPKELNYTTSYGYHSARGVFRGGHWVARIAKLHRKVSKTEAWLPPLQVEH